MKLTYFKEFVRLLRDKDVSWGYKLIPLLGLAYLLWPFDFSADFIPVLGQLDDAAVIAAAVTIFTSLAKKDTHGNNQTHNKR